MSEGDQRSSDLARGVRYLRLADARDGDTVQVEGEVTHQEIAYRPRRQLLVSLNDGSDTCTLRFFNFYPSQQKQMAVGQRIRARGELRGSFAGLTMMHPTVRAAGGALPQALTVFQDYEHLIFGLIMMLIMIFLLIWQPGIATWLPQSVYGR